MRVLSVFGVQPQRIGGVEVFARELSRRLGEHGAESVICYETEPQGAVRDGYLELAAIGPAVETQGTGPRTEEEQLPTPEPAG